MSTFKLIALPGTHGFEDDWYRPNSFFMQEAKRHGVELFNEEDPFIWSTNIDGLIGRNDGWSAAGSSLRWYIGKKCEHGIKPHPSVNIIAHSHAGQIAAYAMAQRVKCHTLITVGTPVRKDMEDIWKMARPYMQYWFHIRTKGFDKWQFLGSISRWRPSSNRDFDLANLNYVIPGETHYGLLDPNLWTSRYWWRFLT